MKCSWNAAPTHKCMCTRTYVSFSFISQVGSACPGIQKVVDALESIKHKVKHLYFGQFTIFVSWVSAFFPSKYNVAWKLLLVSYALYFNRTVAQSSVVGKWALFGNTWLLFSQVSWRTLFVWVSWRKQCPLCSLYFHGSTYTPVVQRTKDICH